MRIALFAAALIAFAPANAADKATADKAVADFIAAPGFESFPVDTIDGEGSAYLARFDGGEGESALRSDAMVGPIEKALLLVESFEANQPDRVRYAVSYGQVIEADGQGTVNFIDLIEVRRYNLGPQIHKATQEDYGPENTAPVEDFGVGEDVAWRFAFAPVMGNLALPLSMSRKTIGTGADQLKVDPADLCPSGAPCRQLEPGVYGFDLAEGGNAKATPFKDGPAPGIGKPTYSAMVGEGDMAHVSSALLARWLSAAIGLTEGADAPGQWRMPEMREGAGFDLGKPFVVFQLDQNLGQDIYTIGIGGVTDTMDDAIAQLWAKAAIFGDNAPDQIGVQTVKR